MLCNTGSPGQVPGDDGCGMRGLMKSSCDGARGAQALDLRIVKTDLAKHLVAVLAELRRMPRLLLVAAVENVFSEGRHLPRELGGTAQTNEVASAVADAVRTVDPDGQTSGGRTAFA